MTDAHDVYINLTVYYE